MSITAVDVSKTHTSHDTIARVCQQRENAGDVIDRACVKSRLAGHSGASTFEISPTNTM